MRESEAAKVWESARAMVQVLVQAVVATWAEVTAKTAVVVAEAAGPDRAVTAAASLSLKWINVRDCYRNQNRITPKKRDAIRSAAR